MVAADYLSEKQVVSSGVATVFCISGIKKKFGFEDVLLKLKKKVLSTLIYIYTIYTLPLIRL